jgi:type I restriction enzyme M protein
MRDVKSSMTNKKAQSKDVPNLASYIWSIADEVLRGPYKPHQYGSVILPFTVMRRLDCVLEPTKAAVLEAVKKHKAGGVDLAFLINRVDPNLKFWNTSKFTFDSLLGDPSGIKRNLIDYVGGFSDNIRDIFDNYKTIALIENLADANLLFQLTKKVASVNLHPDVVSNTDMGRLFEELIRKFSEDQNESPGEHYTPRDAIRLMVELLFGTDEDPSLFKESRIVTLYDPTAGTGGMLSVSEEHLREQNSSIIVKPFGQEINPETHAVCKADMLIKGQDVSKIALGDTLSKDAFPNEKFDYMLSNPPYGFDWKSEREAVEDEHERFGFRGRFGPGLPRISDGQMLFLLHLVSKMHPKGGETSRIAIVMNGSPLFTGGAGSGESEIRRYVIESDLVEAIVGLPTQMFYNTGIGTYVWILSNNKEERRKGKVQLIDASAEFGKMRKSLGDKRRYMTAANIKAIAKTYGDFIESEICKILPNEAFGYHTITVERPLRLNFQVTPLRMDLLGDEKSLTKNGLDLQKLKDVLISIDPAHVFTSRPAFLKVLDATLKKAALSLKPPQYKTVVECLSEREETADICMNAKGRSEPDSKARDTENVPLGEDIHAYFRREVVPYVPDAWIDENKTTIGYEIPFTRYFYKYVMPRPLGEIDSDLKTLTSQIIEMLNEVTA